jgi:DNA polymerase epsilon subunit 2
MQKLDALLSGFEKSAEKTVFVFAGNFMSPDMNIDDIDAYKSNLRLFHFVGYFDNLANLIAQHASIAEQSVFLMIPGLGDLFSVDTLPKPPLPHLVTSKLKAKIKHFHTLPNPVKY